MRATSVEEEIRQLDCRLRSVTPDSEEARQLHQSVAASEAALDAMLKNARRTMTSVAIATHHAALAAGNWQDDSGPSYNRRCRSFLAI